jgi:protein TonB
MSKLGSAPKPLRRENEATSVATILPFRLRASRADTGSGGQAAPVVKLNPDWATHPSRNAAKSVPLASPESLIVSPSRSREWLKQALIAATLLHLIVFAAIHFQFIRDVERAANAGGAVTSDGTTVLDIDIVAEAKLPPSKTPTNMTAPDAKTQTNTPPRVQHDEKREQAQKAAVAPQNAEQLALPQEQLAASSKAETAPVAQSPNQEKSDDLEKKQALEKKHTPEPKKKQQQAAPSTAAAPNRAAANRSNQGQTGANGFIQNGGQAEASSYSAIVLAHLQRFRIYPDHARSAGITGVSTVRFTLGASGSVVAVSLAGSSGQSVLDQAALAMVHRASPFPPIPASLGRGSMTFAAPVRFNLR